MQVASKGTPLTFCIAKWHGYVFAILFLLYGGLKIILGALDHNYDEMAVPFIFLLIGIILISVAFAYRDNRIWGWYGLVVVNSLVVILGLFGLSHVENYVLIFFSLAVLGALFAPTTRRSFFKGR